MRDPEHLLLLCPKWVAERQRYFGDSTDITDVFHDTLFAENVKLSRPVRGRQKATPVAETTTEKNQLTMAETVKSRLCIFSVNHSTLRRVLQKMTAWVMVSVSYRSHRVSSFHSWLTHTDTQQSHTDHTGYPASTPDSQTDTQQSHTDHTEYPASTPDSHTQTHNSLIQITQSIQLPFLTHTHNTSRAVLDRDHENSQSIVES